MIVGTGIDIIELQRIAKLVSQQKFVDRILTKKEKHVFETLSERRKIEFLAGRFAVKEAYAKAVGTGIGKEISFLDLEVLNDTNGKPVLTAPFPHHVHISISHSEDYAVAQVILESSSS